MSAPEEKATNLMEGILLAEKSNFDDFTNSTLYFNEYGPHAIMHIEAIKIRADRAAEKNPTLSAMLLTRYKMFRRAIVSTRSIQGRMNDTLTVTRVKYGLQSLDGAKPGMMERLKMMGGGGGGPPQGGMPGI